MAAVSTTENPSTFTYAAGDVIASKYQLEQLIGEGGMGAVFRARNTSLDMLVAIKLMRADMNRELLAGRLMQEARAAAKLTHPGIVRVFDVGQTALGDPFIVMELLEGETLSQLLDRERKLAPIHAVQLLLPVADALSAAHAKGMVHRDVKPDNVLLIHADEGMVQPKLLDFGIVKSSQPDGTSALSDAGSVVGSPDYMSPEQARGLEHVDARSDLWSFSVVLYEAISGIVPFQATDYATLLRKIVQDEPRTLEELGAASHALSYIVARGLSKDPMARYSSINQMGRALAAWLADQGINEDACGVSLETKWLARQTDPIGFGRASWPPAPRTEHSGVHNLNLMLAPVPSLQVPSVTIPPSSIDPVETEPSTVKPTGRRSVVTIAAVSLVATTLACFGIASLSARGERAPAGVVISSRPVPVVEEATAAPISIASTVLPTASAKPSSPPVVALASPAPTTSASASEPEPPTPRTATARPAKPAKATPAAPKQKQERLSDLLAPMPF